MINVPHEVRIAAARLRSKLMGNRATEKTIHEVATRPVFGEPVDLAYRHGWMDCLMYMEEQREQRRSRHSTRPDE